MLGHLIIDFIDAYNYWDSYFDTRMSGNNDAIPPGSLILVTGANGYIASHAIDILLQRGFNVRGTVRAPKPWLSKYFDEAYGKGRFESVLVPALDEPGALDESFCNASGVLHLVSTCFVKNKI